MQVRGSSAPPDELSYITTQSGAVGLVLQDEETLCKLLAKMRLHQEEQPHQQQHDSPEQTHAPVHSSPQTQDASVSPVAQRNGPPPSLSNHSSTSSTLSSEPNSQPITALQHIKFVILLYPSPRPSIPAVQQQQLRDALPCDVLQYEDVMLAGKKATSTMSQGFQPVPCALSDLATLVYTSGTTGEKSKELLGQAGFKMC